MRRSASMSYGTDYICSHQSTASGARDLLLSGTNHWCSSALAPCWWHQSGVCGRYAIVDDRYFRKRGATCVRERLPRLKGSLFTRWHRRLPSLAVLFLFFQFQIAFGYMPMSILDPFYSSRWTIQSLGYSLAPRPAIVKLLFIVTQPPHNYIVHGWFPLIIHTTKFRVAFYGTCYLLSYIKGEVGDTIDRSYDSDTAGKHMCRGDDSFVCPQSV